MRARFFSRNHNNNVFHFLGKGESCIRVRILHKIRNIFTSQNGKRMELLQGKVQLLSQDQQVSSHHRIQSQVCCPGLAGTPLFCCATRHAHYLPYPWRLFQKVYHHPRMNHSYPSSTFWLPSLLSPHYDHHYACVSSSFSCASFSSSCSSCASFSLYHCHLIHHFHHHLHFLHLQKKVSHPEDKILSFTIFKDNCLQPLWS